MLLSVPADVILERIAAATRTTSARPPRNDLTTVELLLRAGATAEIDARAPFAEVVDELERIAGL